jgi:hypothetical protein
MLSIKAESVSFEKQVRSGEILAAKKRPEENLHFSIPCTACMLF